MTFALTFLKSRSYPHLRRVVFMTAPLVLLLAGGCHDRLYDFGGTLKAPDGSATEVYPDLGGFETHNPDGMRMEVGGAAGSDGGSEGGAAGSDGGNDTGITQCDDKSPERLTDPFNCGQCFNLCLADNADSQCIAGACVYTCQGGFFDADKSLNVASPPAMQNGCECTKTNNGVEVCDNIDNDCDGMKDEGFDFQGDINNCGTCNTRCTFPFAKASCEMGMCKQGACLDGYYDRDPAVPGCETACAKTNGGVEICDGLDNDCNGKIDDNVAAATITCKNKGVCMGTTPTCMGQSGWQCKYPTATFQELENTTLGCDGLDNDCDGLTDEPFDIGKTCVVGSGPCAGTGVWACDNAATGGHKCVGSMKQPDKEVCDGKDNDCDGKVDEFDKKSDSDDETVYFTGKDVTMFVYEASRYDAKVDDHGFDSTRRPCSYKGKQPWTNVTKEEAQAACAKVGTGWRLCTANEWFDACNGGGNTTFPYGADYVGSTCNGFDFTAPSPAATKATRAAAMCISHVNGAASGDELWDMSGNVKEWVVSGLASTAGTGPYELRGGAYDIASFVDNSVAPPVTRAPGLQCDATTPAPTGVDVRLPSVGFRCCRSGQLPP
jgi:hypothetical protein